MWPGCLEGDDHLDDEATSRAVAASRVAPPKAEAPAAGSLRDFGGGVW